MEEEINNYKKIISWLEENRPEQVDQKLVRVSHEVWCSIWSQRPCNCEPDIFVGENKISYPKEILK